MFKTAGLFSVLITSLWLMAAASADSGNDRVKVSALADVSSVQAGKPFWVGFLFSIRPGFHIYWKNPGDSGLATEVKLKLPDGFSAGELMFPVPERLKLPGDIINYAYQDKVMLLMQITPPKALVLGSKVDIGAKLNWLVCKDDCLPGSENLSLELPVADVAAPANEELFKSWGGRLPVTQDGSNIASWKGDLKAAGGGEHGQVEINWKLSQSDIQYLPGPLKSGDTDQIKVETGGLATRIGFDVKNRTPGEPVTGLVLFTTSTGEKMGIEISLPDKKHE